MNLKQLNYVKTLARTRSFIKTAQICNATQPTISNAISSLEDELGARLFSRTTRSVDITPFGLHLLPFIESTLASRDELVSEASAFQNPKQKIIRIGLSPLVDTKYVTQMLNSFKKSNKGVEFFYKECFMDDLPDRIARQQLDVALVPQCSADNYTYKHKSYREPLLFIPQELVLDNTLPESVSLTELAKTPIILTGGACGLNDTVSELFINQNVELSQYPGQAMSYRIIEEWAELGIGAGILPQRKISSSTKRTVPITLNTGSPAIINYYWVWNDPASTKGVLQNFQKFIKLDD